MITLRAEQIPNNNLNDTYGELVGVMWSTLTLTSGYYTDTRQSGTLTTANDNYIEGALIRIIATVDNTEYELGTYAVSNDDEELINGTRYRDLTLVSKLHLLSLDYAENVLTIAKGTLATTAIKNVLNNAGLTSQDYVLTGAGDYIFSSTQMIEAGTTKLSRLYNLTSLSNNRLDIDGHGRVTVEQYQTPNDKTAELTLTVADPQGIIKNGITRSSNYAEIIDKVIVEYTYYENDDYDQEKRMVATATNNAGATRGYTVASYNAVSDLSPRTQQTLQKIADDKLASLSYTKNEWTINTQYIPGIQEGMIIELVAPDIFGTYKGSRKCLVKSTNITGWNLSTQLTLKETAGGNDDE